MNNSARHIREARGHLSRLEAELEDVVARHKSLTSQVCATQMYISSVESRAEQSADSAMRWRVGTFAHSINDGLGG